VNQIDRKTLSAQNRGFPDQVLSMTWFQRPGKRPSPKMIAPVGEPTGVLCAGTDCGSGDRHAKTKLSDRVV